MFVAIDRGGVESLWHFTARYDHNLAEQFVLLRAHDVMPRQL